MDEVDVSDFAMAVQLHELALDQLANGRPAAALSALRRALALDPQRAATHAALGSALQDLGRLAEAEAAFREALRLDATLKQTRVALANTLVELGNFQAAVSCYREAMAESPVPAGLYVDLGAALWRLGDAAGALEAFERGSAGNPQSAQAHYNVGCARLELGHFAAAIDSAGEALALQPEFPEALLLRAAGLAATGAIDAGLGLLDRPGARAVPIQHRCLLLATRLMNSKLFEPARPCLERALREDPGEVMAGHLLAAVSRANPDHPQEAYVRQLFDASAATFDAELVDKLAYGVPKQMAEALNVIRGAALACFGDVLDLGCGTGLVAAELASRCRRLVGIDLAPNMLERARARNVYTELRCTDLMTGIAMDEARQARYEVVTAADVFIYVGKLDAVVPAVRKVLCPGGLFAFSAEAVEATGDSAPLGYRLGVMGRYAHSAEYLRQLASLNGFRVELLRGIQIRLEHRRPVEGWLTVWRG